jgi:uncharacterized RDD family membrane protein YckC
MARIPAPPTVEAVSATDDRNVVSGLATRLGRAALRPARAVVTGEAERAIDNVLAGPLPEAVAQSLVEHRVVERVAAEVVARADLETTVLSALEHEQTERLVRAILQSPALERILADAVESRLTVELTERVLQSPEFGRALKQVLGSPEVRSALTLQTTSLTAEAVAEAGRQAKRLDDLAESAVRRRVGHARPSEAWPVRYGGIATRGVALAVDALLVNLIFLLGGALVGLVASLFGSLRPAWLVGALVGSAWLILIVTYFTAFWSTSGQTPGMGLMRLRVVDATSAPPSWGRSLVRLVGLALAIIPLFAGIIPALFNDRRRALQDFLAGTVVLYDERPSV